MNSSLAVYEVGEVCVTPHTLRLLFLVKGSHSTNTVLHSPPLLQQQQLQLGDEVL